jgi:hypothetical protein
MIPTRFSPNSTKREKIKNKEREKKKQIKG